MATRNGTTTGKLTAKQQRFVEEYLVDPNGRQAAMRAGYSANTARAIASENLTKPNIALAIQRARAQAREHANVSREMVVRGLYEAATTPDASWGNRIISPFRGARPFSINSFPDGSLDNLGRFWAH